MGAEFKAGQRVYTADGRMGDFVFKVENGPFIIRPVFVGYDGYGDPTDEYADGLIEVSEVYAKAPQAKLDQTIADLNEMIAIRRRELGDLDASKRLAECEILDRATRIRTHEQVATLDHFLAGAITHCVMRAGYGTGLKIVPLADALKVSDDDRYRRRNPEMKLLSLFGDSKGDLSWRINEYRDGSGNWVTMVPCTSEDDACAKVAGMLEVVWAGYRQKLQQVWTLSDAMDTADCLGLPIPDDIREAFAAHVAEAKQRAVDKARAELEAAIAKVEAL